MAAEQRTAAPDDVLRITADGGPSTLLRTFRKGDPVYELGIAGYNVAWKVAAKSTPSTFVAKTLSVVAGSPDAQLWEKAGPGPAKVLRTLDAGKYTINAPGNDIVVTVTAAQQTPATPPAPPPVVVVGKTYSHIIKAGEDLSTRLATISTGSSGRPLLVGLDRTGDWKEGITLDARHNYARFEPWESGPAGPGPRISAPMPLQIKDRVTDVTIANLRLRGDGSNPCLRMVAEAVARLTLEDVEFAGGSNGISMHHPGMEKTTDRSKWLQDIRLVRPRILDTGGAVYNSGQGIYAMNVRNLTIDRPFINRVGAYFTGRPAKTSFRNMYRHGMYLGAPNENVVVLQPLVVDAESFALQCRGPVRDTHEDVPGGDADRYVDYVNQYGDKGWRVEGLVAVNCAIGFFGNGPAGRLLGMWDVDPAFHNDPNGLKHGQGAAMLHVGRGESRDVVRFRGPNPTGGQSRMPMMTVGKRAWKAEERWPWDGPVSVARSGERDLIATTPGPDLRDLVEAARSGRPVYDEVVGRLQRAAGTA